MTEIRVLHVMADPMTGVLLVEPIARRQLVEGYQVEFACGPGEYLERLKQLGYPVTVVPIARRLLAFSHLRAVITLWRLMKQRSYLVVHVHTPVAAFIGRLAAAFAETRVVIYHMRTSWWESSNSLVRTLFTFVEKVAGHWTTHIFTINCSDAKELVDRDIVKNTQVTCLHCGGGGINPRRFNPGRFQVNETIKKRGELRIQPEDFVFGFIGRLVEEKGIFELLAAFDRLAARFTDVKLLLVGGVLSSERDQETALKVQKFISNRSLSKQIIQTGFQSDIPRLISLVDVVVLPSYREGFGMVLAEAAAMGKPVISTRTRGGREAVEHGKNGFLVPVKDISALLQAMTQLYEDRELCHRMGIENRRRADEHFDEEIIFSKMNGIYLQLLKEYL